MAGLIGIGQSALSAAYAHLQTTGHNIANVNTPGYVRQEVIQESAGGTYTGAGFLGRGVNVADVARRYDQFIAREVTTNTALAAGESERARALGRLDSLLSDTDNGLGVAMDDLRMSVADLVNRPDDASTREVVIRRAGAMAERFRETAGQLQQLGADSDIRIGETVEQVSGRLEAIGNLNQQIVILQGSGKQPLDMLDQRDKLIDEVAGSLQVTRLAQADGSVNLYSASGQVLVLGNTASKLVTQPDPTDPGKLQVAFQISGSRIAADAPALGTGTIAGLLRFRDQDLASSQAKVGQLSAAVAGAYNTQQALGLDAQGNPGAAMFSTATAQAIPAAGNNGNIELNVAIADASRLRATDYQLSFDGSAYRFEGLADGSVTTFGALPVAVDGLEITVASGSMTIGDQVIIKAASQFAGQMSLSLSDGRALASGYASAVEFGSTNTGTVSLDAFTQTTPDGNAAQPVTLTFTSATTFDITGVGTGNATGVAFTPGQPINYNGWSLGLRGTPAAGDVVSLAPTTNASVDNRNARAMVAMGDQTLVNGTSFSNAFASLVADVGSRTLQGQSAAQSSSALLSNAQASFAAEAGVNLDEEAARLLQYQQAYQAAARIVATANAMFDTILSVIAR